MCTVVADPPLNLFVEHLSLPTNLLENRHLEWSETNDGVVISSKSLQKKKNLLGVGGGNNSGVVISNKSLCAFCVGGGAPRPVVNSVKYVRTCVHVGLCWGWGETASGIVICSKSVCACLCAHIMKQMYGLVCKSDAFLESRVRQSSCSEIAH